MQILQSNVLIWHKGELTEEFCFDGLQAKYEAAMRHENFLLIVTPDWVVDSVRSRGRCEEGLYHPRLLILPKPRSPTPPPAPPPPPAMSRTLGLLGKNMPCFFFNLLREFVLTRNDIICKALGALIL